MKLICIYNIITTISIYLVCQLKAQPYYTDASARAKREPKVREPLREPWLANLGDVGPAMA